MLDTRPPPSSAWSSAQHDPILRFHVALAARGHRRRRGALTAIGIGAIVKGIDGRSIVRDKLGLEQIVGFPTFTPKTIAGMAGKAGLKGVELPTCTAAGKKVTDGASARCFAEYMRVDMLIITGGKTYAQMPPLVGKDGKLTSDITQAKTLPSGAPVGNPARQVWVTETALTTALNTSYMAEQISLFGIAVAGAARDVARAAARHDERLAACGGEARKRIGRAGDGLRGRAADERIGRDRWSEDRRRRVAADRRRDRPHAAFA